jgi:hypothetical protein
LAVATTAIQAAEEAEDDQKATDIMMRAGNAIAALMLDKGVLSSAADFISAVEMGGRNPDSPSKFLSRAGGGLLMPGVSNLARGTANAISPSIKEVDTLGEQLKSQTPGLSSGLRPRLNRWGEPIEPKLTLPFSDAEVGRFRSFIPTGTMVVPSKETKDPLTIELDRLEIYPGKAASYVTIGGEKRKLTEEERYRYQQATGRELRSRLDTLIARPGYQRSGDSQRKKAISRVMRQARERSRKEFIRTIDAPSVRFGNELRAGM